MNKEKIKSAEYEGIIQMMDTLVLNGYTVELKRIKESGIYYYELTFYKQEIER